MSSNIYQVYTNNPSTTMLPNDLLYLGHSPYNPSDDSAIKYSDFLLAINSVTPEEVQSSAFNFATSTGSANAFVVTLDPPINTLTDGLTIVMTANHSNTGSTPTLQVNSIAPVNIVVWSGNLMPNDIENSQTYLLVYSIDNNHFTLINPSISTANTSLVQSSTYNIAADTGTANTYVASLTPAPVALQSGVVVYLEVANTNTGASTLALNGNTAAPIVTTNKNALVGGEMVSGSVAMLVYYSGLAKFVLLNSALDNTNPQNGASRYVVDGGGRAEYTTIQAAINAAAANSPSAATPGVVYIWAGTYAETLTLQDYVYLIGAEYGAVNVTGTMTYAGTGAFYMQNIFASQTGGGATFIASGTGVPTLFNCNLTNTGGTCFQGSAVNNPLLITTELTANAGAKQFALTAGCIVGWTNALGNYTDTASTLTNAGLVIENGSLGGAFILSSSTMAMANSSGSVFNENLAFCAMDVSSVFTAQNCAIYSDAPSAAVVTGNGVFVADMVSLTGYQQAIDPLTQIQGHVNYLGYIVRANNFVPGYFTVVTGSTGGTTAINPVLASVYEFTGTTNQIATLPNANLVYLAQGWTFLNQSTGVITVKNYGGTTLFTMQPYTQVTVTCYNNVGSNGTWLWTWANPGSGGYNPVANYVVSSVAGQAQYQTIQSAINAALATSPSSTTPALIWIFGGNYTENLTLYPWIDLASASDPSTAGVNVIGNAVYSGTGNISLSNIGFTTNNTNAALSFQSSGAAEANLQSVAIDAASGKGLECTSATTTLSCTIGSMVAGTGGVCLNITNGNVELLSSTAVYTDTPSTISGGQLRVIGGDLADSFDVTGGVALFIGGSLINSGSLPCFTIGASGAVYCQSTLCSSSSGTDNFVTGTGTFFYTNVCAIGGATGIDPALTINAQPEYTGTLNVLGFVNANVGAGGFNWVPVVNTAGNFVCEVSPANSILQSQTCIVPDIGPSGTAQFIMSNTPVSTGQTIGGFLLNIDCVFNINNNTYMAAGANLNMYCPTAGAVTFAWQQMAVGNTLTITNDPAFAPTHVTYTIPYGGVTAANFLMNNWSGVQHITGGSLQVDAGNITVGGGNSYIAYPVAANSGQLIWQATNNGSGNFNAVVTNAAAIGQNQTISVPDCGASTANFILSSAAGGTQNIAGALTVGGNPIVDETDGTFTPQLQFGGANVGMTGSVQGYYSRVGNTVTFAITITLTNKGSSTGAATVTGLPIAGRAAIINQNFYAAGNGLTFTSFPIGAIAGASTTLGLYDVISNTGGVPLDDTNFNNTTQLFVSGTYLV